MNLIKPKKLNFGDTIEIIAPAGCVDGEEQAIFAKSFFENLGYNIIFGKNIFKQNRYLAGSDEERLDDLHNAFLNPDVNAIFCLRGGYGAIRLVNKIDYDIIQKNPKIFAGYSDITALLTMFLKKSNMITYHAPMFVSDFGTNDISDYTLTQFLNSISFEKEIVLNSTKIYNSGQACGILFGGNLSTVASLCGLDFVPSEDFIFFAEDLNEPVYKIDKMFTQLLNIKEFYKNLKGIILGEFLDIDDVKLLNEFFNDLSNELNIPVLGGYKITHGKDKLTIPVGEKAQIINDKLYYSY